MPVWRVPAQSGEATSTLSFSPLVNGLLASGSEDGSVRLWDVEGASPALVGAKNLGVVSTAACYVLDLGR